MTAVEDTACAFVLYVYIYIYVYLHATLFQVNEDFYRRTLSGGVITLCASAIIVVLIVSEFGKKEEAKFSGA